MNFFWRSNLAILVLVFVVLAAGDLYSWRAVRKQALDAGFETLASVARLARASEPDLHDPSAVHHWVTQIAATGTQATIIQNNGEILADTAPAWNISAGDPEVQQAVKTGEGQSLRHDGALHRDILYYAVSYPATSASFTSTQSGAHVVVLALPLADVEQQFSWIRRPIWTAAQSAKHSQSQNSRSIPSGPRPNSSRSPTTTLSPAGSSSGIRLSHCPRTR